MQFGPGAAPDSVDWFHGRGEEPTIVSISDVHGYLDAARNALTALEDADPYPPVVSQDGDGRLHWAGNDYLLVVNGDLIDRGPANDECLALVERLAAEAPPGRVRYHLGNHEMGVLFPERFRWPGVYSIELDRPSRRAFVERVAEGAITVAFEGYDHTYSHAGDTGPVDVSAANREVRTAAEELVAAMDDGRYAEAQRGIIERNETVFGVGGVTGRGASAGLLWMDFKHMTPDAPPQVVGHSRQRRPVRTGSVICQNVIRSNLDAPGGEAVVVERPNRIEAVINTPNGATVDRLRSR